MYPHQDLNKTSTLLRTTAVGIDKGKVSIIAVLATLSELVKSLKPQFRQFEEPVEKLTTLAKEFRYLGLTLSATNQTRLGIETFPNHPLGQAEARLTPGFIKQNYRSRPYNSDLIPKPRSIWKNPA